METNARPFTVGVIVLSLLVAVVGVVYYLGYRDLTRPKASYYVIFNESVSGLSTASDVEFNGLKIGKVTSIEIDPISKRAIRVRIDIDPSIIILQGDEAVLEARGLTGTTYIQIYSSINADQLMPLLAPDDRDLPVVPTRPSTLQMLSDDVPRLIQQANQLLQSVQGFIGTNETEIAAITGNYNQLAIKATESLTSLDRFIGKVDSVVAMLEQSPEQIETALGSISDFTVNDLPIVTQNLNRALITIDSLGRNIDSAITNNADSASTILTQTAPEFGRFMREMGILMQAIERIMVKIERDPPRFFLGD